MSQSEYHYDVIKRVIDAIDQTAPQQLSLDELAQVSGLSPAHFQKTFSKWVGVSPKRYQQYLTLDHAKHLLADRHTVLDTALESGLSGSSRLHDLFLRWEAMTPGDYAQGGAGLEINAGWFDSPFGEMLVLGTDKGICGLAFGAEYGRETAMDDMKARWPKAKIIHNPQALLPWINAMLGDGNEASLHLIGAPFQIKVWEALLNVPTGHVTTYSDIAASIGNPKAVRAVGTAVGRNPISWLIPCHRALRKSGELGGYHWGLPVKRALLAREAARFDATA